LTGDRILPSDVGKLSLDVAPSTMPSRLALLKFAADVDGRTYIAKQFAPYPFHICRPFYFSGDPLGMATVYVQSCAGGIFEHDRLGLTLQTEQGSQAHVTTSASTIIHSMPTGEAQQAVNLTAASDSLLEYFPDPMILFPGSRIRSSIDVVLHDGARAVMCDAFLMHDHLAQGDAFDWIRSEIVVRDAEDHAIVRDRIFIDGQSVLARIPGVTGRHMAQASFMCLCQDMPTETLAALRTALDSIEGIYAGVSLLPTGAGVFARVLAADGSALRAAQLCLWSETRRYMTGVVPTPRRK
jgi:urease accessory protein